MIKLISYHHHPFAKHVSAPQNEFGIQKILGQFTKRNWELGRRGENSKIIPYFFTKSVPNVSYKSVHVQGIQKNVTKDRIC